MNAATTSRITAAAPAGGKRIQLDFADGTSRIVDVTALLNGPVFSTIASDDEAFAELFYDSELGTVCWPGDLDIAPEALAGLPDLAHAG